MTDFSIVPVSLLELAYSSWAWPFASERRREINAHFTKLQRDKPELWNGRVLMLRDFAITGGTFRGRFFETDFASLIAWRDWGFPDPTVKNCFAMGALRGSDGGFILGLMAPHTANAGKIYFPAGTPDLDDVAGDTVDLAGSVMREMLEETGLTPTDFVPEPAWITVLAGPRIAQIKTLNARVPAAHLRARILDYFAQEKQPELAGIHVAHGPDDLDPRMPPFVTAFLSYIWRQGRER